jgi:methionyl aminopeptidase
MNFFVGKSQLGIVFVVFLSCGTLGGEGASSSALVESYPPRTPIYKYYPPAEGEKTRWYPEGRRQEYTRRQSRDGYIVDVHGRNTEEARERERQEADMYNTIRKAAEVHRRVRKYALAEVIKPGVRLIDMCEKIENATRAYLEADRGPTAGVKAGIGFPTGCSINSCAAHYTPNPGDKTVLKYDDVMKLDFGTHVNGYIVDSAFTWAPNPKYEKLLEAVRAATEAGIQTAGIDVRLCDVGEAVQEVMESYEVEIDGKTYPVKVVRNLMGHSIMPYQIHAGKSVPCTGGGEQTKMEEGEVFAIETFGSTGKGYVRESGECSHFALNQNSEQARQRLRLPEAKRLADRIEKKFSTLPWCKRYLERQPLGESRYQIYLRNLINAGIVEEYPPLCDIKGSFVAQYEHTIILKPTGKEIVSAGDDGMDW